MPDSLLLAGRLLETLMLVCFGLSWPISILKSLRTRIVHGKSPAFMGLIIVGYLAGATAKIARAEYAQTAPEFTTGLYLLNAVLVAFDLLLYYRFRHNRLPATPSRDSSPG